MQISFRHGNLGGTQQQVATAHLSREATKGFRNRVGRQIHAHGLGTLSEIADGDAPFAPRGWIAYAWTVAEVLRVWHFLESR
jgi:glycogen debranching enzyme